MYLFKNNKKMNNTILSIIIIFFISNYEIANTKWNGIIRNLPSIYLHYFGSKLISIFLISDLNFLCDSYLLKLSSNSLILANKLQNKFFTLQGKVENKLYYVYLRFTSAKRQQVQSGIHHTRETSNQQEHQTVVMQFHFIDLLFSHW